MLQKISDRIQGWVAGTIIAVIGVVFVLWGVEYYISSHGNANGSKSVATVAGKPISQKQLNVLARQLQQRVQATRPNKPLSLQEQKQIKSMALQQLISKTALLQAAEKQGFNASQRQVQAIILQAPEFQVKGFFSSQRFRQFLLAIQQTEPQFLAEVRGNFIMSQVAIGLETSAFVLSNELKRAYQLIYQKRDFGYVILPLSQFINSVPVSSKAVQDYYNQHEDSYKTPEKVQLDYLLLSPNTIEKTITVSLNDLKAYYDSNKAAFAVAKQWKVVRFMVAIGSAATPQQISTAEQHLQKFNRS